MAYLNGSREKEVNLTALRDDASKIITAIGDLAKNVVKSEKDYLSDAGKKLMDTLESDLDGIKERLSNLKQQMDEKAVVVDKTVRKNPYWFLAGAFGTGLILGKLIKGKTKH